MATIQPGILEAEVDLKGDARILVDTWLEQNNPLEAEPVILAPVPEPGRG